MSFWGIKTVHIYKEVHIKRFYYQILLKKIWQFFLLVDSSNEILKLLTKHWFLSSIYVYIATVIILVITVQKNYNHYDTFLLHFCKLYLVNKIICIFHLAIPGVHSKRVIYPEETDWGTPLIKKHSLAKQNISECLMKWL